MACSPRVHKGINKKFRLKDAFYHATILIVLAVVSLSVVSKNAYAQTFDLASTWYDTQNLTGNILNNDNITVVDFSNFHPGGQSSNYSVRIQGFIQATITGLYTFETLSDDGVRLFVDGTNIIDNFINQGATTRTGTINLVGGQWYPILLEHYQDGGGERLRLRWAPPGEGFSFPPSSVLSRTFGPEIDVSSSDSGAITDGGTDPHGSEQAGLAKTVTYTVSNTFAGTLTLAAATASGTSNVNVNSISAPASTSVTSGGSTTFTVNYTPINGGSFSFDLSFANNDDDENPFNFTVTGIASVATGFCSGTNLMVNGGFETPDVPGTNAFAIFSDAAVPGWSSSTGDIEIWDSGHTGVASQSGVQHAELNANSPGSFTGGGAAAGRSELLVRWYHQARATSAETASLIVTDNQGGSTSFGIFSSTVGSWTQFSTTHLTNANATGFNLTFSTSFSGASGNFFDSIEVCQTYLTLSKSLLSRQDNDGNGPDTVGDTLYYRFVIQNPSGNERSLSGLQVDDDLIGIIDLSSGPDSGDTNGNNLLDVGETWIVDRPYTITLNDVLAGDVTNIAFARGSTPNNTLITDNQQVTVNLNASPSMIVTKTADITTNAQVGDTITYTYVVRNDGNQVITNIFLNDAHNGSGPAPTPANETLTADTGNIGDSTDGIPNDGVWDSLSPGDEITLTAQYVVTQSDVDSLQ